MSPMSEGIAAAAAAAQASDTASSSTPSRGIAPVKGKPILATSADQDPGYTEKALLLGMDVGTSRSSIVSMSGTRKTVETYVGYARDPVSRKMLKTDVLYGKAALDNRLAVDLYRPLEKGVIKGTRDEASDAEQQRKNLAAAKDLRSE